MKPFDTVTSVAAWIDEDAIDTDIIFPARFLLLLDKEGLGKHAFHERRNDPRQSTPFILDRPPYDKAEILVAAQDFGTGSSREQAVWALADFGLRCVIAESFGEIFFANCFKNGVLPVRLSPDDIAVVREAAQREELVTIDLPTQEVRLASGVVIGFEIEPYRKDALLNGLDEIGSIQRDDGADIAAFEEKQKRRAPWLYYSEEQLAHFNDLGEEILGEPTGKSG
ncbi:3-isopropylmalate dehydratase small subunit [Marinibacterium profundimaris]|uniref:3-isopropylmalate dehydratase small subunit n=1 Tax=Marinibacterium profundimaris TaxID=1679460 RepID=UPI000B51FD9D|nr:3-isopropylmalate dehydratase small subunit [Marinibacterium profundimaris]